MTVNVDFTGIAQSVVDALLDGVKTLAGQAATSSTDLLHEALHQFSLSGLNFIVGTPLTLITAGADLFAPTALRPVLADATQLALVLAGVSYLGHYWFGWPGLGESLARIATTVIMVGSSFRLMDASVQLVTGLSGSIASRPPELPDLTNVDPLMVFGGAVVWFILAVRLAIQMGKRLIWLAVLYRLGPIALATNLHASSSWIAATWTRLWIGWLVGVIPVTVCFLVSVDIIAKVGLPGGFLISLATLLVAYDVVRILAPKEGMGSIGISYGVGPVRLSL